MDKDSKFNVLILEDEESLAIILELIIEQEGGEAVICGTLENARSVLSNQNFDLLILDENLPDGLGSEVYFELSKKGIRIPAIMISDMKDVSRAVELTQHGLFDFLPKPFDREEFIESLHKALHLIHQSSNNNTFNENISQSTVMQTAYQQVKQASLHPSLIVLIYGETGSGKDIMARTIHRLTFEKEKTNPPFLSLNCTTLPAEMFEAELFGAEKGAYTGAFQKRDGLVTAAQGGTLFLDEIGELTLPLQAKLLSFLETREYRSLGSNSTLKIKGRIITATNRNLDEEVANNRFRSDLFYRLEIFSIYVPPLRERKEDTEQISYTILSQLSRKYDRPLPVFSEPDLEALISYNFPGNVRELKNLLERSLLQTPEDSKFLQLDPIWRGKNFGDMLDNKPVVKISEKPKLSPIEKNEYDLIKKTMVEEKGVIRKTAKKLGFSHQTLLRRLKKWPELKLSDQ